MDELKKYFLIEREIENYGKINMRCVGVYDIENILEDDRLDLLDDTHPLKLGFFMILSKLKEKNTRDNEKSFSSMAFFVALEEDNIETINKSRKKCILTKKEMKKVLKWQQSGGGYFTPPYLDDIKDLDELKNSYRNRAEFKF